MEKIFIYTDGGSRGNPGIAGAGAVINDSDGKTIKSVKKGLGIMTNNEAEYEAVILGLMEFKKIVGKEKLKKYKIEVMLDSELVVRQLSGKYKIKEERLISYFVAIHNMQVGTFPKLLFTHIPREKNKDADKLANDAMDSAQRTLI